MKKSILMPALISALHFCPSLAWADSGCEELAAQSSELTGAYFQMINYEHLKPKRVMEFESRFTGLVNCAVSLHGNRESALILVYGALLLKNNSQGAASGAIPYTSLIKHHRYSPEGDFREELAARAERSVELLELAQARDPSDRRIPGWIAGARIGLELSRDGQVSREAFRQMMREAKEYPEFNALTALLALSEASLDPSQEQEILEHSERMLDLHESPCSPLKQEKDRTCSNSAKAPYNLQNSMAMLSDVLLRESVKLGQAGSRSAHFESRALAGKAKMILAMNLLPHELPVTLRWSRRELIFDRMNFATRMLLSPRRAGGFWGKSWRGKAYQCASCHSPNH